MNQVIIKSEVMNARDVNNTLGRLTHEIIELNHGIENMVFVGILTRGVHLAQRFIQKIEQFEGVKLPLGTLDVTLYRDDMAYRQRGAFPAYEETSSTNNRYAISFRW